MSEDSTHKKSIVINTDFFKSSGRGRPRKFSSKSGDDSDGEGSMGGGNSSVKIPTPRRNTTQKLRTPSATSAVSTASSTAGMETPNRMREMLLRRIRQHQRQVQQQHLSQIQSRNQAMLSQTASGVPLLTETNRGGVGGGVNLTPSQRTAYNQLKISPTVRSLGVSNSNNTTSSTEISSFDDSLSYLNEVAKRRKMERELQQKELTERERTMNLQRLRLQPQPQSYSHSPRIPPRPHQEFTRKYPGASEPAYGNLKGGTKPTYKTLKARNLYSGANVGENRVAQMTSSTHATPIMHTTPVTTAIPTVIPSPQPTQIMDSPFDDAVDSEQIEIASRIPTEVGESNQIIAPIIPPPSITSITSPQISQQTYPVSPSISLDRQQRLALLRQEREIPQSSTIPQLYRNRTPPMQLHPSGEEITRKTQIQLSKTERPTMEMFVDAASNLTAVSNPVNSPLLTEVQPSDIDVASTGTLLSIPSSITPSLDSRFKKYRIKTRRRIYKLGKDDKERKVSVLIKNHHTRKTIQNQIMDLNKISMYDIKKFLRERNLLRVGSEAPDDVLREIFRAVKLAGDIQNQNSDVFLHNFFNKEKDGDEDD